MKIKRLDINNIASIAHASIDFTSEPLSDSPIFLICGETGSGKSTILDAICLALYDKTPRLANGKSTEDKTYSEGGQEIGIDKVNQLLKKGEKEGAISLWFDGVDGSTYLAEWKCRVNRNGKLEDEQWSITDSKGITDTSKKRDAKMAEIIGLDYDEFCRTSMLAQGQFTQFLKADTKDKSDILEKITGTEIYARIGKQIHEKSKNAYDCFKDADRNINSVTLLPSDTKEQYLSEMSAIESVLKKDAEDMERLEEIVKSLEILSTANSSIAASNKSINDSKTKFVRLAGDLECRKLSLSSKLDEARGLDKAIAAMEEHSDMFKNVQAIEAHLENIDRQGNIQKTHEKIIKKAEIDLENYNKSFDVLAQSKEEAEVVLTQKNTALAEAEEEWNSMCPKIVEQQRQAIAEELDLVSAARSEYASIRQREKDLELYRCEYSESEGTLASERETLKGLDEAVQKTRKDFAEVQNVYNLQAQVLDKAAVSLREWLRETGFDECPVCHSKIVSLATDEQEENNLKPLKDHLANKKKIMEEAESAFVTAQTALSVKEAEHTAQKKRIDNAENELRVSMGEFALRYASLQISVSDGDISDALDLRKKSLNERKEKNEWAIRVVNEKRKHADDVSKELSRFRKETYEPLLTEYNDIDKKIATIKANISAERNLIEQSRESADASNEKVDELISYPDWKETWSADSDGFMSKLRNDAEKYNNEVRNRDDIKIVIERMNDVINSVSEICSRIIGSDSSFGAEAIVPVECPGNVLTEWGALERGICVDRDNIKKAEADGKKAEEALSKAFEADDTLPRTRDELLNRRSDLSREMMAKSSRRGEIKNILDEDERKLKGKRDLIEKRDAARIVYDQWKTLDDLFGGAEGYAFKKIAQSYIMQDILNHANSYLRKIAPRYELTAQPGSLVILVRDTEEGGVRSGNTLSGGEGFVISLSLALGLSSLAENSMSVDTIFIDEGFGTLSQEWLNSVMSALEKLNSTSGKHVGIISHIEDLQRRIPTVIEVKKKNASTSEIFVRG